MLRGSRRLSCSCKFSYIGYGEPKIWLQPVFSMQRTNSLENILMLGKLKTGGEGEDRGWDGWMASLTWWTWVLASSGSWWWEGNPSTLLQSIGSQRFGHDWVTELKTDWHTHTDQPPYHHQKGTTVIVFHGLSHLVEMYGVSTKNHAPTIVVSMANSYVSRTSWARYWVLFTYLIVLGCHRCSQGLLS